MPMCRFGWWLNTTRTSTSATCAPEPRSHCRAWSGSIASDAAVLHVLGQSGVRIQGGEKAHDRTVYHANLEFELSARRHAPERSRRQAEVRGLSPGNDIPVWLASDLRRLDDGQQERTVIEHQGHGARSMNITGLTVCSRSNVYPQSVAQGAAAVPFGRAHVGEAGASVRVACRGLRAWHEFDRFLERAHSHPRALVEDLDGLDGGSAGAADAEADEQNDGKQRNSHAVEYTGT